MKYDIGAKVRIKSMNQSGTVQKVLPFDRYSVRVRRFLTNSQGEPLMSHHGRQRFTVESHNLPEVELELSRAYNDGTANSDRGLTTLEGMDVDPETVALVFIKKVKEDHNITGNWVCDKCNGTGKIWEGQTKNLCDAGCTLLKNVRGSWHGREAFGKKETRLIPVTVAYPQWTKGVKMDSRFRHGKSVHEQCELCSKPIPSGRLVAVEGVDSKLQPHGLYIGLDCAKKFTGYNVEFEPLAGTQDVIVSFD